ncbi:hypothetical protein [Algibacter sp. R77976]|uniref:hypothetical protein n=1 Tax=Algibacter sp. R77976 TaxID=3093873 RepID=UPI0037C577D3
MWFLIVNSVVLFKYFLKKNPLINGLLFTLIVFSSFYTISLFEVSQITFHLKIPEYLAILLILTFIISGKKLAKKPLIYFLVLVSLLSISLIVRYFDFEPVKVWEVEDSKRSGKWAKTVLKEGVSFTNFTQMLYVVLGGIVFVLVSSIKAKKKHIVSALFSGLQVVNLIAILQLFLYYSNNYDIYMHYFYSIDEFGKYSVTAFQTLFNSVKRINSVQTETSIFGYYLTTTFLTLFLLKVEFTKKQKRILYISSFLLLISTSFTGYLGVIYFFFLTRIYDKKGLKMFLWIIIISILAVILVSIFNDVVQDIIIQKTGSFKERLKHGITLPLEALSKMPIFGLGIGTDRPSIMLINILVSIGYFGFIVLSFFILYLTHKRRELKYFLIFIILIGMTQSNFHYLFVWCYMGILYKKHDLLL